MLSGAVSESQSNLSQQLLQPTHPDGHLYGRPTKTEHPEDATIQRVRGNIDQVHRAAAGDIRECQDS